jgi:hypothetical protein
MGKFDSYTEKTILSNDDLILIKDSVDNKTKKVKSKNAALYKKYIASLSQGKSSQTSGLLIIGRTYVIEQLLGGDDFSNVGYISNTPFVATGTTPDVWTNSTEVIDAQLSAPIAVILENTLDATPIWSYAGTGIYNLTLAGAFPLGKTFMISSGVDTTAPSSISLSRETDSVLQLIITEDGARIDGAISTISPGSIEIRIYQ